MLLAFILAQCHTALHRCIGSSGDSCGYWYLIHHITGYTLKAQKKFFFPQKTVSFAAEFMEAKIRQLKTRLTYGAGVFNYLFEVLGISYWKACCTRV